MAGKGFVHINGTTYETSDVVDAGTAEHLVTQLLTYSRDDDTNYFRRELPTQRLDVVIAGSRASLVVVKPSVWATAAWYDETTTG